MGSGKDFPLSITLRSVDKATPGLERVNKELEKTFAPYKRLGKAFSELHENLGLDKISAGFKGIAGQVKSLALGIGVVGGAGVAALVGLHGLIDDFDKLGDKAEALGIGVAPLVQLRYAAQRSGAEVEALDSSLATFNKNIGQVSAGTGRFTAFLKKVSPALLHQVKGAKSSEEAFDLLADAMAKLHDQGKKTALAVSAGFDPSLIPLLSRGAKGIHELRDRVKASSEAQAEAAKTAGPLDDAWKDLHARLDAVKASIVVGLGPAFGDLTTKATAFLDGHQREIAGWISDFGEKLPSRIAKLGDTLSSIWTGTLQPLIRGISDLVQRLGGAENAVKLLVGAWVTFQGLQLGVNLFKIGQGVFSLVKGATALAGAFGPGVGVAGQLAAALALGYAFGTQLDHLLDLSGKLSNLALSIFGEAGFAQSEATGHSRARAARFKGKSDQEVSDFAKNGVSLAERNAAYQELAARSSARDGRAGPARPTLGVTPPGAPKASEAHVTVELKNAPPGTRVKTEPSSTADVDWKVGYQMTGLGW